MSERPKKRRTRRRGSGQSDPPAGAAEQHGAQPHPPAEGGPPAPPRPEQEEHGAPPPRKKRTQKAAIQLKSARSLERLKERVEAAVEEIERLRRENATLAERISQLEGRPLIDEDGALLVFDEDSEALRRKVDGFIAAIDHYLGTDDQDPSRPAAPPSDVSPP